MTPAMKLDRAGLTALRDRERELLKTAAPRIFCCSGTGCHATGSIPLIEALRDEAARQGGGVQVVETGCNGFCALGPVVVMQPGGILYCKVRVEDAADVVVSAGGEPVERLLYRDPKGKAVASMDEIPFFALQRPRTLRNKGRIDPENIGHAIAHDGYQGLAKALFDMDPAGIVEEMRASGLRGRGGAGFPTGLKWKFAAASPGDLKYVLCNADEGDPGAFMDRSILESDPHAVLEGMLVAAVAIGSRQGYIYCRSEYPLAIKRLTIAIGQARELGLLGENILGSGFSFDLEIYQGAGAFVCGEETALMRSIEGKRGMPVPRPPFPAQKGLWGKPTILNNVETLANVSRIIRLGGAHYASVGTEGSKGTKVFALSGDVNNIGLVEVDMGTPLSVLVNDIGGGVPGKRKCKAVQLGGPSGGSIPAHLLDTPVDYEAISQAGAIMGSGGVIVMDDRTCMVDMARFFMDFIQDESCGKCTPCREGTRRQLEILTRICEGKGVPGDLRILEDLAAVITDASLCGLGQTASNPILSALRHFRDEFEAHINERRCPAKRCVALLRFEVREDLCRKCGLCHKACPAGAVIWAKKQVARIDREKCVRCLACFQACPFDCIE
ncbi:NADH-quinone oxidoreductase subunit F/NAD(P)H dehydrogenase (quinone)/NADP-reducing hydrogenase subunit HndC [Desulfomicrobium norvegicum]|uniref:NADH-quinone oxidoreductase subunit F/NAD(P)H dehydrogenase (Quinone)/NADP-reducing hydrogenase subunit HndC n=1 Tax=Desulfomicrobium norvegicum (strain DSM 1741 / NCIMB 8310) TaxID=52561 RepID=A0A8G2C4S2_DESNO|nr:NADH-quinone oxidoreductase subunit NuoF [Desulfomicrobium norvegicum]SFM01597.1 NADH-quinone oxidoreductase subunit F/NAD(P)H dehydrogenase (quinone)/NADP-reducing hydrogenase subunit HndC [Desulfomicrobium norvegicum]